MRNQLTEKDNLFENLWLIFPLIDMFYGSVFVLFRFLNFKKPDFKELIRIPHYLEPLLIFPCKHKRFATLLRPGGKLLFEIIKVSMIYSCMIASVQKEYCMFYS